MKSAFAPLPTHADSPDPTLTPSESTNLSSKEQRSRTIANQMASPMFYLSILFLTLVAILLTIQVYVPRLAELAAAANVSAELPAAQTLLSNSNTIERLFSYSAILLLAIWPLFLIEHFYNAHAAARLTESKGQIKRALAICLCPPLRLGATSPAQDNKLWLPGLGWREPGRQLCKDLQQKLSMPMLVIALTILPVLLIEKVFNNAVIEHAWLRLLLNTATGFIWLAFTTEFIVMVNSSAKKIAYIKANWIDLAIILLPLIAFLRSFSLLAKLGKAYRMRGIVTKTMRALALLEIADRLTGNDPVKKLQRLTDQYQEKMEELEALQEEIKLLEAEVSGQ